MTVYGLNTQPLTIERCLNALNSSPFWYCSTSPGLVGSTGQEWNLWVDPNGNVISCTTARDNTTLTTCYPTLNAWQEVNQTFPYPGDVGGVASWSLTYTGIGSFLFSRDITGTGSTTNPSPGVTQTDLHVSPSMNGFAVGLSSTGVSHAVTFGAATQDITWTSHGFTTGTPVAFQTTTALPAAISPITTYYVSSTGNTTNTFRIVTASDGSGTPITFATAGTGTHTGYGNWARNISVVQKKWTGLLGTGQFWNPDYITAFTGIAAFRHMQLMHTYRDFFQYWSVTVSGSTLTKSGAHGMGAGTTIMFEFDATKAATGIDQDTAYYVLQAGLTSTSFQFSTTPTGAPISPSGYGATLTVFTFQAFTDQDVPPANYLPCGGQGNANGVYSPSKSFAGPSPEFLCDLANRTNSDLYINVPGLARTSWSTAMATRILAALNSTRKLYVEYSNEMWSGAAYVTAGFETKSAIRFPGAPSTTSNTIASTGNKTFALTNSGTPGSQYVNYFAPGNPVVCYANGITSGNSMTGTVSSYSGGSLVVSVSSSTGSGTFTSWNIQTNASGAQVTNLAIGEEVRHFQAFQAVWTGANRARLVCVAASQAPRTDLSMFHLEMNAADYGGSGWTGKASTQYDALCIGGYMTDSVDGQLPTAWTADPDQGVGKFYTQYNTGGLIPAKNAGGAWINTADNTAGGPTAYTLATTQYWDATGRHVATGAVPSTPTNGTIVFVNFGQTSSGQATLQVDNGGVYPLQDRFGRRVDSAAGIYVYAAQVVPVCFTSATYPTTGRGSIPGGTVAGWRQLDTYGYAGSKNGQQYQGLDWSTSQLSTVSTYTGSQSVPIKLIGYENGQFFCFFQNPDDVQVQYSLTCNTSTQMGTLYTSFFGQHQAYGFRDVVFHYADITTNSGQSQFGLLQSLYQPSYTTVPKYKAYMQLITGALAISPSTLPPGTIGVPYNQTVTASGGTSPYTYTITPGSLPAGLAINSGTGAITGTPTTAGTSNFTVHAVDSASTPLTGDQPYSVTVSSPTAGVVHPARFRWHR